MKPVMRKIGRVCLGGVLAAALVVALVASPAGRVLDRQLTAHFREMNERREEHKMSWADGVQCRLLYTAIALGGRLVSPEGGQVIWHYLHGQGKDLWLSPDYIKTSPVVIKRLALLRNDESRRFTFKQAEDMRLSYAINPFNMNKLDDYVLLWQLIEFDAKPHTYTTLSYGIGSFRVPDALIYSMHPKTYTVYCQWRSPK